MARPGDDSHDDGGSHYGGVILYDGMVCHGMTYHRTSPAPMYNGYAEPSVAKWWHRSAITWSAVAWSSNPLKCIESYRLYSAISNTSMQW